MTSEPPSTSGGSVPGPSGNEERPRRSRTDGTAGDPAVSVSLSDEQAVGVDRPRLVSVARRTARSEGAAGEISITLVTRERIAELNDRYMGRAAPTDVLSFPIDGPGDPGVGQGAAPRLIGEVVLCPEVAAAQAEAGLDPELDLLVAHGVLHLLGFDHETEAGAAAMRERERRLVGRAGATA